MRRILLLALLFWIVVSAAAAPQHASRIFLVAVTENHAVTLTWAAGVCDTCEATLSYNVYIASTSGGPYTPIGSTPVSTTTFVDAAVISGTTRYYVVTAVGMDGQESAHSNEAKAVIPQP